MNNDIFLNNYKERSIFDSNVIEFWAPITDRSFPNVIQNRYWISSFGRTWNSKTNKPIGLSTHKKGYYQFSVMTNDGKQICRKLHRVVMTTFCYFPECENYEVNHKDGIKTHNWLTNLEWCTHSENTIHAINMGLKTVFGVETSVILSDNDVANILALSYLSPKEIKKILKLDVSEKLIANICSGKARVSYHNNLYNNH